MNTKHEFCPGCGAQVYPEEAQCPFCGRSLRNRFLLPVVAGVAGTAVALVSGALVWWVLSSPPSAPTVGTQPMAATPQPAAPAAAPTAAAPPAPAPEQVTAPPVTPPQAPPAPSSVASSSVSKDQSAFAPPPSAAAPTAAPALPKPEAPAAPAMPSLATVSPPSTLPAVRPGDGTPVDADARRAFAKSKQESFAQNGLDLKVSTSGPEETTLTISFNFSAKTAAELIIAGPFPKQCEQRGFKTILFEDPTGTTWVYDIATQKMTLK